MAIFFHDQGVFFFLYNPCIVIHLFRKKNHVHGRRTERDGRESFRIVHKLYQMIVQFFRKLPENQVHYSNWNFKARMHTCILYHLIEISKIFIWANILGNLVNVSAPNILKLLSNRLGWIYFDFDFFVDLKFTIFYSLVPQCHGLFSIFLISW